MLSLEAFPVVYENARLARVIKGVSLRMRIVEAEALAPRVCEATYPAHPALEEEITGGNNGYGCTPG